MSANDKRGAGESARLGKDTPTQELLSFLVRALLREAGREGAVPVPDDMGEAFDLFRSLCNVRPPLPADPEFLRVQDLMLGRLASLRGVTLASELPACSSDGRLALWHGDITTLRADAIVNAANSQMLGCFQPMHGCIDNVIHTMAGIQLRLACAEMMAAQGHEEPVGHAKVTPGFNLPAKHVIHTVGPLIEGMPTRRHQEQLAACYTSCLDAAHKEGCATVAFPCISTGAFMFPNEQAARIAVDSVRSWLDRQDRTAHAAGEEPVVHKVVFDLYTQEDMDAYQGILGW